MRCRTVCPVLVAGSDPAGDDGRRTCTKAVREADQDHEYGHDKSHSGEFVGSKPRHPDGICEVIDGKQEHCHDHGAREFPDGRLWVSAEKAHSACDILFKCPG